VSGAIVVPRKQDARRPGSQQLRAVLSRAVERRRPRACIVDMERVPCPYGSSWWLEEITLELNDGSRIALVFKDLLREANGSGARQVKPAFVTDPTREPWVYQNLLMGASPGPPAVWAALTDAATGRYWLFIERVRGVPLAHVGDRDAWCAAAEWLGRFHATAPAPRARRGPLLRHTQEYHGRWLARALSAAEDDARTSDAAREKLSRLRALASAHERATRGALATGASLIHGEFYASNVLIEQSGPVFTIHPVDWEMAALGPPLVDLAALMSGRWRTDDRIAMATAYRAGAQSMGLRCPALGELLLTVAACRLLSAVQWLGWATDWTAPADHRNDWLEEAERCASELRE
jgi:aminoglycoside phosphotransferase (APT) family kinase protein